MIPPDPQEIADQAVLELRRDKASIELVVRYINARIDTLHTDLAVPLITERQADMLRGKIAELKKLLEAVQNTGEDV